MVFRTTTICTVGALALALAACNSTAGDPGTGAGGATDTAMGDDGGAGMTASDASAAATAVPASEGAAMGEAMPLTGQAFVDAMAASDRYEIEAARIAEAKGVTGKWRDFAQMMTRDHTASSAGLRKALAGVRNVTLDEAPPMTPAQRAQIDSLQAASGADFQRMYADQQVAAHQTALQMLQTYARSGDVKPLMDFAGKTAKVVAQHLSAAQGLT